jgi:hypothetical protein
VAVLHVADVSCRRLPLHQVKGSNQLAVSHVSAAGGPVFEYRDIGGNIMRRTYRTIVAAAAFFPARTPSTPGTEASTSRDSGGEKPIQTGMAARARKPLSTQVAKPVSRIAPKVV